MNFQTFFCYLGKIATNLGIDLCRPNNFQTAKCTAEAIHEATLCSAGAKLITGTSRTLANDSTFTHTATERQFYVFTSVTSTEEDQGIFINGVDTGVALADGVIRVVELCEGDVMTVVDPAAGAGAAWIEVLIPVISSGELV